MNGLPGAEGGTGGILCGFCNDLTLVHNTVTGCAGPGIRFGEDVTWHLPDPASRGLAAGNILRGNGRDSVQVDGVIGPKTAAAIGITLSGSSTSKGTGAANGDVYLLAQCIYSESRGEPYKGQVAVGAIVLNRVKSSSFPNSISGVIFQRGAFSAVDDGQINLTPNDSALKAAKDAMNGWDPTGGCLYYYNPAKTSNRWIRSRPIVLRIGNHVFCK